MIERSTGGEDRIGSHAPMLHPIPFPQGIAMGQKRGLYPFSAERGNYCIKKVPLVNVRFGGQSFDIDCDLLNIKYIFMISNGSFVP